MRLNASRLRFETGDDALRHAQKIAEHGRCWAIERGQSFSHDYLNGLINIHLEVSAGGNSRVFKFIPQSVPFVNPQRGGAEDVQAFIGREDPAIRIQTKAKNTNVLIRTGNFKKCPQQVISTIIWPCGPYEINDFRMNITTAIFDTLFEITGIFADGIMDTPCIFSTKFDGGIADRLIESVSSIVQEVGCEDSEASWDSLRKPQLDDFFAGLVVAMSDDFIIAGAKKGGAGPLKLRKVFPSRVEE